MKRSEWMAAVVVTLAAGIVFGITASRVAYPGDSIRFIVEYTGISPRRPAAHGLWEVWVYLVSIGAPRTWAWRLNLASAFWGALAIGLFYRLMSAVVVRLMDTSKVSPAVVRRAGQWAGAVAALALAFSPPFWFAATRAYPATFHVFLLLALTNGFERAAARPKFWRFAVLAFFTGLAMTEYAGAWLFAPILGVGLLVLLLREKMISARHILVLAAAGMLGFACYGIWAGRYQVGDAYDILAAPSKARWILFAIRDQWSQIRHSLPQVGWALVLLTTFFPWLLCALVCARGLNSRPQWGLTAVHAVLLAATLAAVMNARFAPWQLLGPSKLMVFPYLFSASTLGYLAAVAYVSPRRAWRKTRARGWQIPARQHLGTVLAGLLLLGGLALPALHWGEVDSRDATLVDAYAQSIVRDAGDRDWLVTDGILDPHIALHAHMAGGRPRLLNLALGHNPTYVRFITREFEEPRLRSLATVGLGMMVREWLRHESDAASRTAILGIPDLWVESGYWPVPAGTVFTGMPDLADVQTDDVVEAHVAFSLQHPITASTEIRKQSRLAPLLDHIRTQQSMLMNNAGILAQAAGETAAARRAYRHALEWKPENPSALLNRLHLAMHDETTDDMPGIGERLRAAIDATDTADRRLWALSRIYGYVAEPGIAAAEGHEWAWSGMLRLASPTRLRSEMALSDPSAEILSQARQDIETIDAHNGEQHLQTLLEEDPHQIPILISLARLNAARGDHDAADRLLDRAQAAGAASRPLLIERVGAALSAGSQAEAVLRLAAGLADDPEFFSGWNLLAGLLRDQHDMAGLRDLETRLARSPATDPDRWMALAQAAAGTGNWSQARRLLGFARAERPSDPAALALSLELDIRQGRADLAVRHVRELLAIAPDHPLANYVLGTLHINDGEYALAEDALLRSKRSRRHFAVLNDLAWAQQAMGKLDEAERHAREALALEDRVPTPWDTLGVTLTKAGRFDEAESAFQRALQLAPTHAVVQAHLCLLYAETGRMDSAKDMAKALLAEAERLPPSLEHRLRRLLVQ